MRLKMPRSDAANGKVKCSFMLPVRFHVYHGPANIQSTVYRDVFRSIEAFNRPLLTQLESLRHYIALCVSVACHRRL